MRRALKLAENGTGYVSPNPKVGSVIVKDNQIISEGWHKKYGSAHAEVEAINNAKIDNFEDCTIYVNLEPCSHYGKTPPCAELIVNKKFKRVVIGSLDPNPLVSGKGIEIIKNAGIEVITDVLKEECYWINRIFFKHIIKKKPYIMLKIAQTIDASIALKNGESKWITCEKSRIETHKLRSEFDAILVGKNTVLNDDPTLNVRLIKGRDPYRIICDTNLAIPLEANIFKLENQSKTIICTSKKSCNSTKAQKIKSLGANILKISKNTDSHINLEELVNNLYEKYNITSIMVEGGAGIYSSFLKSNLVDELQIFTAPKIFGNARNPFEMLSLDNINDSYKFELKKVGIIDSDIYSIFLKK